MSCIRTIPVLLLTCGLLLAGCDQSASAPTAPGAPTASRSPAAPGAPTTPGAPTSPAASNPAPPAAAGPRITFERSSHQFGSITDTRTVSTRFAFTNTGTETLVISDIKAACGCTVPTLAQRQFAPGEGDAIEVRFDPRGRSGNTDKEISVVSNAVPNSVAKLKVNAVIEPMVRFARFHRLGEVPLGQEHTSTVYLAYDDPDLTIDRVTVLNNPHVSARVVSLGKPRPARGEPTYVATLEVTISPDAPWGVIYATRVQLTVTGRPSPQDDPIEYDYSVFVAGDILGDLRASPMLMSLGVLKQNQAYEKAATLSRTSGAPFTVTGARVSETSLPGVQVRVEPGPGGGHRVVAYGTTGTAHGGFKGVISVTTDVPGEENLILRFAGSVK